MNNVESNHDWKITYKKTKMKTVKLNKKDLKKAYNEGCPEVKQTLKNLYPDVEFEKKLAESWKEYMEMKDCRFISIQFELKDNKERLPTYKECFDKYTALYKLELLRDHYNGDWKATTDINIKFSISKSNDLNLSHGWNQNLCHLFLTFKTEELRDKFLSNFKDLIESAEDLI